MNSTDTGRSVTWSWVVISVNGTRTSPAIGMTANAVMAGTATTNGASMKTSLSAAVGVKSSLNISFMPSASDCSRPNGPFMFGPLRCCMNATTRRSYQMVNNVSTSSTTKANSAFSSTTHQRSFMKTSRSIGIIGATSSSSGSMVTTSPAAAASSAPTHLSGARLGTQTTPSTMVGSTSTREAQRTAIGRDRHLRAHCLGAPRTDPGDRRADGRPQVRLAVQGPAVIQRQPPGREHGLPVVRPARLAGLVVGGLSPVALPDAELLQFGPRLGRRAEAEIDTAAVGESRQHPKVGHRRRLVDDGLERADPALPVHEAPFPLVHQRHREDHIGALGDQRGTRLQADHEIDGFQPFQHESRIAEIVRVDPGHHQRGQFAVGRGDQHLVAVATLQAGQRVDAPGGLGVDPRGGIGQRTPTGQQIGQAPGLDRAPITRAPRNPGQPGTGPLGEPNARAQRAGQAGCPLADHDDRVRIERDPRAQRVERGGLRAGHRRQQLGADLAGAVAQIGRERPGLQTLLAVGLAQPEEDRAGLLLRLEADQQHRARGLQVGEGHPASAAGHDMGQEVGLLVGMLAGPEVDVVRAEHRTGELGVRVRVLHGQPATGQHARGPAGRLQALDRDVDGLRPGRRPQHAAS